MTDVVVTVPQSFGLDQWIAEGDLPGEEWDADLGLEWDFYLPGFARPSIKPGERVYVLYKGKIRGYAPLVRVQEQENFSYRGNRYLTYSLVRHNGAVAVTVVDLTIRGFRGFKYRLDAPPNYGNPEQFLVWRRDQEVPFPDWMVP